MMNLNMNLNLVFSKSVNLNLKVKNKINGSNSGDNIFILEIAQAYYASSEDHNYLHIRQIFNRVVDVT